MGILIPSKTERKIRQEMELITKKDLRIYKKLGKLFRQLCSLEKRDDTQPEKIKRLERKILKAMSQIREDALNEIGFTRLLKPKNKAEEVIIDIFGPFSHPPPKDTPPLRISKVNRILKELGVDLYNAEPTGKGHWKAPVEGTDVSIEFPKVHGRKGEIKWNYFNKILDRVIEAAHPHLVPGSQEYNDMRKGYRRRFREATGYS